MTETTTTHAADVTLRHRRLAVCQTCTHRRANRCGPAKQITTILVRLPGARCPQSLWPGDPDPGDPDPATVTPANRPEVRIGPAGCRTAAVVIVSHNYGRFIVDAVRSVLGQSRRPDEVLIVDDASTDNTAEIAEAFAALGVRYLRTDARNVLRARQAGFEATTSDVVCFLDADDELPAGYLETGLPLFADGVGVVNSDFEYFGLAHRRRPLDFDADRFQQLNSLHAGCLIRRAAIEASDAWSTAVDPLAHEDWALFRKIIAGGWRVAKNPTPYRYRKHGASATDARLAARTGPGGYFRAANLANESVTICTPLAGRTAFWPRFAGWLERQTWPKGQTPLLMMDLAGVSPLAADFGRRVRRWLADCEYDDVRYLMTDVAAPGLADADRRQNGTKRAVQQAMPRIYNRLLCEVSTEYFLIVEDDVVPPVDVVNNLMRHMAADVASVAAPYQSRFHSGFVAWGRDWRTLDGGHGVQAVGGNGFGCTLLRRSVARQTTFTHQAETGDFDWNFYYWLARHDGGHYRALLDWSSEAEHGGPHRISERDALRPH